MPDKITIAAYRCNTGGTQINLSRTDQNGHGMGYRLAGPKHHNLGTTTLVSAELEERDAHEIRTMLDGVFPLTVHQLRHSLPGDDTALHAGLYTNQAAAKAQGFAECKQAFDGHSLMWKFSDEDDDGVLRLFLQDDDGETPTGWHIVPLTAAAEYDPDAEG